MNFFLENDMCHMPWKDELFSSQQNLTTMVMKYYEFGFPNSMFKVKKSEFNVIMACSSHPQKLPKMTKTHTQKQKQNGSLGAF